VEKDQAIGAGLFGGCIAGILIYGWLVWFVAPIVVLQVTAFVAIAVILGILAWIGWTMATTPPPAPIETEPIPTSAPPAPAAPSPASSSPQTEKQP
jgi:predicted DNA-binding transcriptional regulator